MTTVHLHVRNGARTTTLVFSRFPIRIGREPPCECRLAFPFVSRSHAVLALEGGRLVLRDLGSKGGTFVRDNTMLVDPANFVDLEKVGWEFQIGRLSLRADVLVGAAQTPGGGLSAARDDAGDPDGTNETRARCVGDNATRAYGRAGFDPGALHEQAVRADLADVLARYRSARAELEACVRDTAHDLCAPGRAEALQALGNSPLENDGDRRSTEPPPPNPVHQNAEVALRALQDLAAHYVPYAPPLIDAATIASFSCRLERALRLVFDGVAALRFVYRAEDHPARDGHAQGIDIGARLLDWTATDDPLGAFEAEIIEMIQHHARLTNDVSAGIAKLLAELDPEQMERAGSPTWPRGFQYRRFWETYRYRHHRLTSDASVASLFGPRFGGVRIALGAASSARDRRPGDDAVDMTAAVQTPIRT
jgi:predicted component of type VI protein secretion system